ncbi:MAG: transcriptional regulator [Erythrobacter sp.]|nr:transcriptional regulator [Erythrobacter sp.]|tara:strand:- start:148 stop:498 length:351 start_codon:yes stop_codon:yes gene_type:complete
MNSTAPRIIDPTRADALFHALGDANRRRMVGLLSDHPATISELSAFLDISKTAVGQHLAVLEKARLARSSKVGRTRTCQLDPAGLVALQDWINFHRREWEERLERLGDLVCEANSQ